MLPTYKAILRGDRLEWREEKPETVADRELAVIVTILDEPASSGKGAQMASALERLAAIGGLKIDGLLEGERALCQDRSPRPGLNDC